MLPLNPKYSKYYNNMPHVCCDAKGKFCPALSRAVKSAPCAALALWCATPLTQAYAETRSAIHAGRSTAKGPIDAVKAAPPVQSARSVRGTQDTVRKTDAPQAAAVASGKTEAVTVHAAFNSARARIAPNLGAVAYRMGQAQINTTPGGENAAFNQVLLRMPGVVMDSFGEEHVRGEHGGLTYRINGVLLPEGLNGFGQELDTRIIDSVTLMTGTLPAQFGFRTAGIVDVTAKSGNSLNNKEISFYGGSYNTFNPSFQVGGTKGQWEYFVSGSFNRNNIGIENPTPAFRATHDVTEQGKAFGYASYHFDDTSRISLLTSISNANFEIPNAAGLPKLYDIHGVGDVQSQDVNDRQNEQNYYVVLSYQKTGSKLNYQVSPYFRYGAINYTPDPVRDMVFQGVAEKENNTFTTGGLQFDASYDAVKAHTIRFGVLGQYTSETLWTRTDVLPVDEAGFQTSVHPMSIQDNSGNWAAEAGAYLQDEWKLLKGVTLNYGVRYDRFESSFDHEGQASPRANLVWEVDPSTTVHFGYSRYFAPPTAQYIGQATLLKFAGTTNSPENFNATATKVERSNYFDIGLSHRFPQGLSITVDGFYKQAKNLGDLGQFGRAVILTPFSYRTGKVYGAEFGGNYHYKGLTVFGNFSFVNTAAKDVNSAQYQFPADELEYIKNHAIKLDHEGEFTSSAGVSYGWAGNKAYVDFLYGYGLRSGFANTEKQPSYHVINIGYEHVFRNIRPLKGLKLRVDVTNLFDERYQIRNGSGLGVFMSQYGQRRAGFLTTVIQF